MKKVFTLLTALFFVGVLAAQIPSNVVIFSEDGNPFYLVLNGIQQNEQAQTNVKVTGLIQPTYKAKIIFANKQLGEIDKNLFLEPGTETTAVIKLNKKAEYVVRFQSSVPIAQAIPVDPSVPVIVVQTTQNPNAQITYSESTTTTVNTNGNAGGANTRVGVNMGGKNIGFNMNVNVNDMLGGGNVQTSQTTTTTTTTTTTSSSSNMGGANMNVNMNVTETGMNTNVGAQTTEVYVMPGYNGRNGCNWPMDDNMMRNAINSISSKSFEDSKKTVAMQIVKSKCITVNQLKQILNQFTYEDTKLEFAKFAFDYTFDIDNYFMVNDVFTFESSIDELNEYISAR